MAEIENETMTTENETVNIEREKHLKKFNSARSNLLIVIVFTFVNMILLMTNANRYFLFSASIPYAITDLGMYLCGKYPAEYYGADYSAMEFWGTGVFVAFLVIAILILGLYLLCWFMSKKQKSAWLIVALVMFALDTLAMFVLYGVSADIVIDIVFHVWAVYYLVIGVMAQSKLKKMEISK